MSSDLDQKPAVMRAHLTELRARKYYLECEKAAVRATIKVYEAKLSDQPTRVVLALIDDERATSHDSAVAFAAVNKAGREYAAVVEREHAKSSEETAKAAEKEEES